MDWSLSTRATVWILGFIRIPNVDFHKDITTPGNRSIPALRFPFLFIVTLAFRVAAMVNWFYFRNKGRPTENMHLRSLPV